MYILLPYASVLSISRACLAIPPLPSLLHQSLHYVNRCSHISKIEILLVIQFSFSAKATRRHPRVHRLSSSSGYSPSTSGYNLSQPWNQDQDHLLSWKNFLELCEILLNKELLCASMWITNDVFVLLQTLRRAFCVKRTSSHLCAPLLNCHCVQSTDIPTSLTWHKVMPLFCKFVCMRCRWCPWLIPTGIGKELRCFRM